MVKYQMDINTIQKAINEKSFMTGWEPIYSLEKGLTEYKEYLES